MKNVTKKLSTNKKNTLIFGFSGQDRAYLASYLLGKGYKVIGTVSNKPKKYNFR